MASWQYDGVIAELFTKAVIAENPVKIMLLSGAPKTRVRVSNDSIDTSKDFLLCYMGQEWTFLFSVGNILENKELLASLNQTKASSNTITSSLQESIRLQTDLDKVGAQYS